MRACVRTGLHAHWLACAHRKHAYMLVCAGACIHACVCGRACMPVCARTYPRMHAQKHGQISYLLDSCLTRPTTEKRICVRACMCSSAWTILLGHRRRSTSSRHGHRHGWASASAWMGMGIGMADNCMLCTYPCDACIHAYECRKA